MSCFTQYKLKDGRKIKGRYYTKSAKVCISRTDLEELIYEADVAYEQAKQLQTIIENLAEIKRHAITKVLNEIRAQIEQLPTSKCTETCRIHIDSDKFKENVLAILDKQKVENKNK